MPHRTDFNYQVQFSRRRTLSIIIRPDKGVVVKAPNRTPRILIERFVKAKSEWIMRTLDNFNSLKRIDPPAGYSNGDNVLLFGREYILDLRQSDEDYVKLREDDIVEISHPESHNPLIVKSILEAWFRSVGREMLTGKFREVLNKYKAYNFAPTGFSVRKMKKRWGSCSSKGKIAVSYDLIRLDEVFAEYVIVHELCHLRHHNHSENYYALLTELYPGWKKTREEMRRYIR